MPDKVLIITYYWPPSGGAGVQRWVKFAKYMPEFGWEPIILTVDRAYAAYPVTDSTLLSEIPVSLQVFSTPATDYFTFYKKDKSKIPSAGFAINNDNSLKGKLLRFIRGNFFIPDPRKGWNRFALHKASELIRIMGIRNVITTSPPHSTQLIGLRLKKRFPGINWITDLRDPWTDIYYYDQFYPTILARLIDAGYERKVLKTADSIITVGESLKELYSSKVPGAKNRATIISNGYDEEDFSDIVMKCTGYTITYTGTLSDIYPIEGFLKAITSSETKILLRFIGAVSDKQKRSILTTLKSDDVQFTSYTDHRTAVRYTRESSALLLIIPKHVSSRSILTGKLFEYLASGRPVICLGPTDGDAAKILDETGHGKTFGYDDTENIKDFLKQIPEMADNMPAPKGYSRKELTRKLISMLQATGR
ncbi:MAG TPA: hypothetical protein VHO46_08320 [Bacteroidales bacterium]|nr:hypothetical protein [Bacteroidales bacterium]